MIERIDRLIEETSFLPFDNKRKLFSIGYVRKKNSLKSYYDLLASEARQASLISIARVKSKRLVHAQQDTDRS